MVAHCARGIEKESLRVTPDGQLSAAPHPPTYGSPLTHPQITTDFSEAQLELITGVHPSIDACLTELDEVHRFVYAGLPDDELLWAASMPCLLGDPKDIPVGRYGSSNIAMAKTVYRLGLGNRYGRLMQTISGIHYNFSVGEPLWAALASALGVADHRDFRSRCYFNLIRNFRLHSWLLIYLFGASPAVCRSFLRHQKHALEGFDEGTLHLPFATALRMGSLGYQSDAQAQLAVSYNSLADYVRTLKPALVEPYPPYEQIGVKVDGEYRQLATTLLQIENEFYGTIRPKQPINQGERPLNALLDRGVRYVEVRCLDLNPFLPLGIDAEQIRFIDTFLLYCLLAPAPEDDAETRDCITANQRAIVEAGRKPGLMLAHPEGPASRDAWGGALLDGCAPLARLLDDAHGGDLHGKSLALQRARVADPTLTPSAQTLAAMQAENIPFFRFAMNQSLGHCASFADNPLPPAALADAETRARDSLAKQAEIEAQESEDFDHFLARYIAI